MAEAVKIGVSGALGRMGRAVIAVARGRELVSLAGRLDRPGARDDEPDECPLLGVEALLARCDVVVDFSSPASAVELATAAAARAGPALVIGTTGLSADQESAIRRAADRIPIVRSGNFSVGVNVLAALVEEASRRLPPELWDIEIVEAHHRRKVDAPSGTAHLLAAAAARGRGESPADVALPPRDGITGPRPPGRIGISSVRGGGLIGEHDVIFAAEGEILTLSHSARDRGLFAIGAVEAALWISGRPAGLYGMVDVLGCDLLGWRA